VDAEAGDVCCWGDNIKREGVRPGCEGLRVGFGVVGGGMSALGVRDGSGMSFVGVIGVGCVERDCCHWVRS
jgi:hypothetical protein